MLARLWPCHREHIRARLRLAKVSCSSLYLILQTASFWRWPVHCRWWSGSDHFFPRNRDGVKECLQRRLAEDRASRLSRRMRRREPTFTEHKRPEESSL